MSYCWPILPALKEERETQRVVKVVERRGDRYLHADTVILICYAEDVDVKLYFDS